ncbi:50S ribosomal protein L25 [Marinicrinis sediminis]|uniref:Large ribosomal subunit protein bL25 n=1 Tax=Marinicrinis sediminis TaxID=1652465 RepID=A0ABW5R959_9BACL
MSVQLQAEKRDSAQTASELRQLRNAGHIPAVVYGKEFGSVAITVSEQELNRLYQSNPNQIVELDVQGDAVSVLLQDMQRDALQKQILHADFHQIQMNEQVQAEVPLIFTGEAVGVKEEGGLQQVQTHQVVVRCMPAEIPGNIEVPIDHLHAGDHLSISDLETPQGVEIENDPSEVVVTILTAQKLDTEEEVAIEASNENENEDSEEKAE